MKAYKQRCIAPLIHNLGTRWRRVTNFKPPAALFAGEDLDVHEIEGWVGLRAGLDGLETRKTLCSYQDSNPPPFPPEPSISQLSRYTDSYSICC